MYMWGVGYSTVEGRACGVSDINSTVEGRAVAGRARLEAHVSRMRRLSTPSSGEVKSRSMSPRIHRRRARGSVARPATSSIPAAAARSLSSATAVDMSELSGWTISAPRLSPSSNWPTWRRFLWVGLGGVLAPSTYSPKPSGGVPGRGRPSPPASPSRCSERAAQPARGWPSCPHSSFFSLFFPLLFLPLSFSPLLLLPLRGRKKKKEAPRRGGVWGGAPGLKCFPRGSRRKKNINTLTSGKKSKTTGMSPPPAVSSATDSRRWRDAVSGRSS
jgi:hypothetical protein